MANLEVAKPQQIVPEQNVQSKPFYNPICQQTYEALPKIYGNPITTKRKFNINRSYQHPLSRHCCMHSVHQQCTNSKTVNKKNDYQSYKRLSEPKFHKCKKKYCLCNSQNSLDTTNPHQKPKISKIKIKKIKLPQLNIKQPMPDDFQSRHKVLRTQPNPQLGPMLIGSGLGLLVSNNAKINAIIMNENVIEDQQHQNPRRNQDQQNKLKNKNNLKKQLTKKPHIYQARSSKSSKAQMQRDNEKMNILKNPLKHKKIFKQQAGQSSQGTSKRTEGISISSSIFRHNLRQNTMFNQFNHRQQAVLKRSRVRSTLSNGLFKIPQANEYDTYIQDYKPIDANFSLKKIINEQNFKIVRMPKGVYFGQVNQNMKNGQGVMVTQKEIYQGIFQNNIKIKGCERNIDGVYIGEYVNGQRSGQGIFRWNNGEIFEGQWREGTKNGHGIWTSPKGDYYDGQWLLNRQQGFGTFRHKNSTYKGNFLNFLKHGHGEERFANGDFYIGQYSEGKPHGKGRYQWSQGGYYQGTFIKGYRQGQGKWVQSTGDIYQGGFYHDFKHGKGKQVYKNGQRFVGQFKQGCQLNGSLYGKNGKIISVTQ